MANSVRWALRGNLPIETDAQENVQLVLRRNDKRKSWVLHLANNGVNNQYSIGFDCIATWDRPEPQRHGHPVRTCFTSAPFSVTLHGIAASDVMVRSLAGTKIRMRKGRKSITIVHSGLKEYDVIILTSA